MSGPTCGPDRPIRVLRVIARMNVGGPAWQASVLTRGLDGERWETLLVCGDVGDDEADFVDLRDPSLPLCRIPSLGRSIRPGDDLRAWWALRRIVRTFGPDVIHTHTAKAGVIGRLAGWRVPVRVHTFHGHVLHGYFGWAVTSLVRLVESILARKTTALVAVGGRVRDDLRAAGIGRSADWTVIAPGVASAVPVDRIVARRQLGLPVDRPLVLFVGRITAVKRLDRLLEAMAEVVSRLPEAILAVAGEGDLLEDSIERSASLGESIRFLGWRQDLAPLYAAADVVAISSDNEGMPVTLIEAAMAGIPAVTTDVGSAGEVVVDGVTGYVVPPDVEALAEGLVGLLTDHEIRARMGGEARLRAEELFGVERLVADHARLYERLVDGGRASPRRRGRGW